MESDRDFSDDVKINKYKLEDECMEHPGLYLYWAELLADAKSNLDAMKEREELTTSKRELYYRTHWVDSDGKQTEGSVAAKLVVDDAIQEAKENRRKAQAEVNTLNAAVSALEHRKAELDNLVTLLIRGFYAAPNGGKHEGQTEAIERDIRKSLNKSRNEETNKRREDEEE